VIGHRWVLSRAALSEFRVLVGREVGATVSLTPGVKLVVADASRAAARRPTSGPASTTCN